MEQQLENLRRYFDGDESALPGKEQLIELMERYPYFAAPVAALLRCYGEELDATQLAALRNRLALLTGDGDNAARSVELTEADFYPPVAPVRPNTADALDMFFEKFGKSTPEEDALLERMIFNPVPDYLDLTGSEAEAPLSLAEAAAEIGRSAATTPRAETPATTDADAPTQPEHTPVSTPRRSEAPAGESLLSESLAKIFIKQGRYERAYEIISNLNLNYPEKSVYFADQLRFLRKLIILQRHQGNAPSAEK